MATHVYANGCEIASKSADGSSKHAFPDVCHTPPATAPPTPAKPFPPGAPIPYPNTCYARDITNGSRTVFILGKEIALEDDSYFSTSEGDDAATKKLAKGIVSGAVKGRGYFQTWSPNVFVEGRAVARHMDMVSHNHLNPGNTGLFPYLSNAKERRPCDKTEKRIDKACEAKPDPDKPAPKKEKRGVLSRMFSAEPGPAYNRDWRKDHCDFLQFSAGRLSDANAKQFLEQAKQAREQIEQARQALDTLLSDYGGELLAKGGAALVEQAAWSKIRSGLYVGGGTAIGAGIGVWAAGAGAIPGAAVGAKAGTVAAIAHSAYSAYEAALLAMDGKALFDTLTDEVRRMRDTLDPLARYTNPDGSIDTKKANTFLADMQDALATADDCTRARKCNLVPKSVAVDYTDSGVGSEIAAGRGCCPGQTGHHLLSNAMIKDTGCGNYDYSRAPTVCVEGYSQYFGSHRRIHTALGKALQDKKEAKRVAADGTLSLDDGIDAAVQSHTLAFLASGCDPQCTRAQLEAYYKSIDCPMEARVNMVNDAGKPTRPTPSDGGI